MYLEVVIVLTARTIGFLSIIDMRVCLTSYVSRSEIHLILLPELATVCSPWRATVYTYRTELKHHQFEKIAMFSSNHL